MDARMSQQAMEGLPDEPGSGEKHREPEGQVVGGISLGTFLLPQESTSPVGARTHHWNLLPPAKPTGAKAHKKTYTQIMHPVSNG